jgi:outer membrane receptor for monomeric catechols
LEPYNRGVGKAPFVHISKMLNAFTSYRFSDDVSPVLRRTRIGGGANYRGPAVIGYDSARTDAVILGKSSVIANLMLGRTIPLRRGQTLDVQLNIDNLFKNEDPLPYSATAPGNVVRSILPRVRHGWNLRATYTS